MPENALAARFSIPHALASCIVLKDTGIAAFSDSAIQDPRIRALAARVIVQDDWKINSRTPLERPAVVRIELRNGRVLQKSVELPLGEFDTEALSDNKLSEKFLKLTSNSLDTHKSTTLLDKLWHIETAPDIKEVIDLARGG